MKRALLFALLLSACSSSEPPQIQPAPQPAGATTERIPLRYTAADEVAGIVRELMEAADHAAQQSTRPDGGQARTQPPGETWRVEVDARTNSLVVRALPADLTRIRELVERLDVEVK